MISFWWARVKAFLRSGIFRQTLFLTVLVCVYTASVNHFEHYIFEKELSFAGSITAFFGATISLLMVFRTNGAYDRWWEGRKQWGALVNHCRNLTIKLAELPKVEQNEKEEVWHWVQAFPYLLKEHLRGAQDSPERREFGVPAEITHAPGYASRRITKALQKWRDEERLDQFSYLAIDVHVRALLDICGACERILKTPLPLSHRALIPQVLFIYLAVLPWGMPNHAGAIGLLGLLTYFLVGLELVADGWESRFA